jgi:hypothetical protein
MLRYSFYIFAAFLLVALSSGCANSRGPAGDKNTNWLKQCESDTDCGNEISCLCGICSESCESKSDCANKSRSASCVSVKVEPLASLCASAKSKPAGSVCLLPCLTKEDCSSVSSEMVCVEGSCISGRGDGGPLEGGVEFSDASNRPGDSSMAPGAADGGYADGAAPPRPSYHCGQDTTCELLVSGINNVKHLLPGDDNYLYWVEYGTSDSLGNPDSDGAILRIPNAGGEAEIVVDGLVQPWRLYLDATNFYWLSGCYEPEAIGPSCSYGAGYTLWTMPRDGSGEPVVKASGLNVGLDNPLVLGADRFYWVENDSSGEQVISTIWSFTKDPSFESSPRETPFLEMPHVQGPVSLIGVDESGVYYETGSSWIRRMTVGGLEETLIECCGYNGTLAGDYMLYITDSPSGGTDMVAKVPKAGGEVTNLTQEGGDGPVPPRNLLADSTNVYSVWGLGTSSPCLELEGSTCDNRWEITVSPLDPGYLGGSINWWVENGIHVETALAPVWTVAWGSAWVYTGGQIVRFTVGRTATPVAPAIDGGVHY